MAVDVLHGDCLALLPTLPADSVHAIITDPPYHLTSIVKRFGAAGAAAARPTKAGDGRHARLSKGFMGQTWDGGDIAMRPEVWAECLRVLKPGGHLVAFGGTRTFHRVACAIEDAGFEIRDCLSWLYGSGFPKSHDVAKGIDSRKDWPALKRFQAEVRKARKALMISQSEAARRAGIIGRREKLAGGGFMWFETGMRVPTREQYQGLKRALNLSDACDGAFEAADREVIGQHADDTSPGGFGDHRFSFNNRDITAPATPQAQAWQGWGTALKPAWEPIIMARKPLAEKSVARNVLEHGTGAINVDGCRIDLLGDYKSRPNGRPSQTGLSDNYDPKRANKPDTVGRWPANVVHDGSDEVEAAFAVYGEKTSGKPGIMRKCTNDGAAYGAESRAPGAPMTGWGDSGSPSRFFYSGKAGADDRLDSKHPTVKPVALMRWLVRLVTPPGGVVLDPFAGTGSTGIACIREGFDAVLIERDDTYHDDIRKRLARMRGDDTPLFGKQASDEPPLL